jgi:hypothetical protein
LPSSRQKRGSSDFARFPEHVDIVRCRLRTRHSRESGNPWTLQAFTEGADLRPLPAMGLFAVIPAMQTHV